MVNGIIGMYVGILSINFNYASCADWHTVVCLCVCPSVRVHYCYNCSTVKMKVQLRGFIGFSPCFPGFTLVDLRNKVFFFCQHIVLLTLNVSTVCYAILFSTS